jgi:hypothetical protein
MTRPDVATAEAPWRGAPPWADAPPVDFEDPWEDMDVDSYPTRACIFSSPLLSLASFTTILVFTTTASSDLCERCAYREMER